MTRLKKSVARQIRDLMLTENLTQTELAQLSGIDQCNVSRALNPRLGVTLHTLERIADGFGLDLEIRFVRRPD